MAAPGKDLTTTWWPTFLRSLRSCICFIIEFPSKRVVNDLSASPGVESLMESSRLRGSKQFQWLTCWGGSRGFGFFVFWLPETFFHSDLFSSLDWSEGILAYRWKNSLNPSWKFFRAVFEESLSSVSFFTATLSSRCILVFIPPSDHHRTSSLTSRKKMEGCLKRNFQVVFATFHPGSC